MLTLISVIQKVNYPSLKLNRKKIIKIINKNEKSFLFSKFKQAIKIPQ